MSEARSCVMSHLLAIILLSINVSAANNFMGTLDFKKNIGHSVHKVNRPDLFCLTDAKIIFSGNMMSVFVTCVLLMVSCFSPSNPLEINVSM